MKYDMKTERIDRTIKYPFDKKIITLELFINIFQMTFFHLIDGN